MKHIAIISRCLNKRAPYTATGLGDRIHSAIIGWAYGRAHDTPVTLHLTADKWTGGQFGNKPESWAEIVSLFPAGALAVEKHAALPDGETDWLKYLAAKGIDAEAYWYGDYPAPYQHKRELDIVPYLSRIPQLAAEARDVELPERFVTVQWDSTARSRTLPLEARQRVLARYREQGYEPVVVGGESEKLRWSLKDIAYAMSRAAFHVGVDSAFFHLAQLFMPWERIHLYAQAGGHHVKRAVANGSPLNLYL